MKNLNAFSLIEVVIVLTITLVIVGIIGFFIYNSMYSFNRLNELSKTLSDYTSYVDYFFTKIYRYTRSYDKVTNISPSFIEGEITILGETMKATMLITQTGSMVGLLWLVDGKRSVIIPSSTGIEMKFIQPDVSVIEEYGPGVFVKLTKFIEFNNKTHKLERKIFIPFINTK